MGDEDSVNDREDLFSDATGTECTGELAGEELKLDSSFKNSLTAFISSLSFVTTLKIDGLPPRALSINSLILLLKSIPAGPPAVPEFTATAKYVFPRLIRNGQPESPFSP